MAKKPYNYSLKHIKELRAVILLRKMSVPDDFKSTNSKRLRSIYNGIGPEAWSSTFRGIVTKALSVLESPALIHDFEYSHRAKSYWRFTKANFRLMWNSWLDGRFRAGIVAALLCQIFGYGGYKGVKR